MKRYESKARHRAAVSTLTAAPVVLFAVLALIASIAFVGITAKDRADAYIPGNYSVNGTGGKPKIDAKMTRPSVYKDDVVEDLGDKQYRVHYAGSVEFKGIENNSGGEYTVIATASEKAPFDDSSMGLSFDPPSAASIANTTISADKTTVTYKLKGVQPGAFTATFTGTGTYSDKNVDPKIATLIYGTISASFTPSTEIKIEKVKTAIWANDGTTTEPSGDANNNLQWNTCVANTKFVWRLPNGGYLMDLKFADRVGDGITFLKPVEELIDSTDNLNKFEIQAPNNVVGSPVAKNQDATKPFYGAADPIVSKYPNARWVDSLNWKYTPAFNTGETWLAPGSLVTAYRQFRYNDCKVINGVATPTNGEFIRDNAIIANLEIGKNAVPVHAAAQTSIITKGEYKKPAACVDISFTEGGQPKGGATYKGGNAFGRLILDDSKPGSSQLKRKNLGKLSVLSDAMAESQVEPIRDRLYFIIENNVEYVDLATPGSELTVVSTDRPAVNGDSLTMDGNLAFDKEGVLWGVWSKGKTMYIFSMNMVKNDSEGKPVEIANPTWENRGRIDRDSLIKIVGKSADGAKDILLNSDGDFYWVQPNEKQDGKSALFKLSHVYLQGGSATSVYRVGDEVESIGTLESEGQFGKVNHAYGLAWGPDNKMYIGIGEPGGPILRLDGLDSKRPTARLIKQVKAEESQRAFNGIGDLSSCSFDKPIEDNKPEFRVEKRAIDPADGSVLPAGTKDQPVSKPENNVDSKIDFGNGNQGTARYVVTVSNIGTKEGKPGTLSDTLHIPSGVKVTGYKVKRDNKVIAEKDNPDVGTELVIPLEAPSSMAANSTVDYSIEVDLLITDLDTVVTSNQLECEGATKEKKTGFFNHVSLESEDEKYTDDNDACVPGRIPPTAELRLIKQVLGFDGSVVAAGDGDAGAFHLAASSMGGNKDADGNELPEGTTKVGLHGGIEGNGVVPSVNTFARVVAGTYQLSETVASGQEATASKYSPYADWKCTDKKSGNAVTVEPGALINVVKDSQIECVVVNAPSRVKVQKFALDPVDESLVKLGSGDGKAGHVGKTVYLSGDDYHGELKYLVSVENLDTSRPINTETIRDSFTMPKGLVWDYARDKDGNVPDELVFAKASVTARASNGSSETKAMFPGGGEWNSSEATETLHLSKDGLGGDAENSTSESGTGAALTSGISNLEHGKPFFFEVTIPVRADMREIEVETEDGKEKMSPAFDKYAAALKECSFADSSATVGENDQKVINDYNKGAINKVSMTRESKAYSDNWEKDNYACIPVELPNAYVVKVAKNKSSARDDQGNPIIDSKGDPVKQQHAGNTVWLHRVTDKADPNYGKAVGELVYEIKVGNAYEKPEGLRVNSGPVYDKMSLPKGLDWDATKEVKVKKVLKQTKTGEPATSGTAYLPGDKDSGEYPDPGSDQQFKGLTIPTSVFVETNKDAGSKGVLIARNVKGIENGKPFVFEVTIPVVTVEGGAEGENFSDNAQTVGECELDGTDSDSTVKTDSNKGVINTVLLERGREYGPNEEVDNTKDNKACIPVKLAKPHVIKNALEPGGKGPHVGEFVTLKKQGEDYVGDLKYSIEVSWNDDSFGSGGSDVPSLNTGSISDRFKLPAGLKPVPVKSSAGTKTETGKVQVKAKAPANSKDTKAAGWENNEVKTFDLTADESAEFDFSEELTSGITNLKVNEKFVFEVTIPVKADMTEVPVESDQGGETGTTTTVFEKNKFNLGKCEAIQKTTSKEPIEPANNKVISDPTVGVINTVVMEDEDTAYNPDREDIDQNDLWEKDNVACIPVGLPGSWNVEKKAQVFTVDESGEKGSISWDKEGTRVSVETSTDQSGKLIAKTTATYLLEVENTGVQAQFFPEVNDTLTLQDHSVVDVDGVKIVRSDANGVELKDQSLAEKAEKTFNADSHQLSIAIPADTSGVEANKILMKDTSEPVKDKNQHKVYFTVTIPVTFDVKETDWASLSECTEGSNVKYSGGLPNEVTVADEVDGKQSSWACVPVEGGWSIEKLARAAGEDAWAKVGDPADAGIPNPEKPEEKSDGYTATYMIKVSNDTGEVQNTTPEFTDYAGASFLKDDQKDENGLPKEGVTLPDVKMTVTYVGDNRQGADIETVLDQVSVFEKHTIPAQVGPIESGKAAFFRVELYLAADANTNIRNVVHDECEDAEGNKMEVPGIKNTVEMTDDFDGDSNNTACVPLTPGRKVVIQKTDASGTILPKGVLDSMTFRICPADKISDDGRYTCEGDESIAVEAIDGTGELGQRGLLISKENLIEDKEYLLIETKAPKLKDNGEFEGGFELLAQPLKFKLVTKDGVEGIELIDGESVDGVISDSDSANPKDLPDNTFIAQGSVLLGTKGTKDLKYSKITVRDPRAMTMPHSGGLGEWPFALGGMVLIGAALLLTTRKTSGVSVRS